MSVEDKVKHYNYDSFVPEKFEPHMKFDQSPALGEPGPDFPLWLLDDQSRTTFHEICSRHTFTVVEFGSFT